MRIISVISGKGGAGKTTAAANIGAALAQRGKNIMLIDANLTTPNLSLHLGIPLYPVTLHDVLRGKAYITEAIYLHPSGMRIVPASLSVGALKNVNANKLQDVLRSLIGKAEIVLIDAAAGLGREALAALDASNEALIVTNPELTAVTDALKTIKIAEKTRTKVLGVILNRVKGHKHELTAAEVQSILDYPVIAVVPEDSAVAEAIAMKTPVVHHSPKSSASKEFKRAAAHIVGEIYREPKEQSLVEKLFGWLR